MIPLIPVEEAHFAKSVAEAEFVFKIDREFPPFPINRAASGIASTATADGTKLSVVVNSVNTIAKFAKALIEVLNEFCTWEFY